MNGKYEGGIALSVFLRSASILAMQSLIASPLGKPRSVHSKAKF